MHPPRSASADLTAPTGVRARDDYQSGEGQASLRARRARLAAGPTTVRPWGMAYFLEYVVPAESGGAEVPLDDDGDGVTIPLGETAERVVHLDTLPARSRIAAGTVEDARDEAEQLLLHSKADAGELFDDPDDSLDAGSGQRVGVFREGTGWTEG